MHYCNGLTGSRGCIRRDHYKLPKQPFLTGPWFKNDNNIRCHIVIALLYFLLLLGVPNIIRKSTL